MKYAKFLFFSKCVFIALCFLQGIKVVDPQPVLKEWLNQDGTLSFLGFTRLVHGRSRNKGKKRNPAKISLVNTDGIPLGESPCNSPHV